MIAYAMMGICRHPWPCGLCRRYVIMLMVVMVIHTGFIFDKLRRQAKFYELEDIRRLSEILQSKVESQLQPLAHLRPWIDPPPPMLNGMVWNATEIKWFGNSFCFPSHSSNNTESQLYTPHQIQKAFRHHSILLQGDSTFRRLYGTLHGVLSYDVWTGSTTHFPKGFPSQVPNPPFGIPATYFVRRGLDVPKKGIDQESLLSLLIHSPSPIDPRILDHRTIIDVNKEFLTEPCNRRFPPVMNQLVNQNENANSTVDEIPKFSQFEIKVCRPHPTGGWLPPSTVDISSPQQQHNPMNYPLLYDYMNTNCLGNIYDFVTNELLTLQSITRHYTIYMVGPGVWETVKQTSCHHPLFDTMHASQVEWPDTLYQLLHMTLEKLAMLADQSPDLLIIWRTSGYYDGDEQSYVLNELNRRALAYIDDRNKNNRGRGGTYPKNFLSVDFGSAVEHRSQGKQRLRGDMQAHYGLDARILQVQMLTNMLYEYGYVRNIKQ